MPDNFKQILDSSAPAAISAKPGLQVICLGLSRTGTSSLKAALTILQGRTFHAMDFLNQINEEVESQKNVHTYSFHSRNPTTYGNL
jgi:hypothetical protein